MSRTCAFPLRLLAVLLPVLALAYPAQGHPNDACMVVRAFGQQGDALELDLAIEKTPQLVKLERDGNDEKSFFVRWFWSIEPPGGGEPVRVLEEVLPVELPFETIELPHCDLSHPGGPGGDDVEHVRLLLSQTWDGLDAAGQTVPGGEYPFELSGQLLRVIETGNENDEHQNVLEVGRFGGVEGTWTVTRLQVTATAFPTSGPAPLPVAFSAIVDGAATQFEWDFDGDGSFDFTSNLSPNTMFTYPQPGTYQALLRATAAGGGTAESTIEIEVTEGLVAEIVAHPLSGFRPLTVTLSPKASSTGPPVTGYRWDFDGNGTFDTGFEARPTTRFRTYSASGDYLVRLQVRDASGRTADAVQLIEVRDPAPLVTVQVVPTNGPAPLSVVFSIAATSPNGAIVEVVLDPGDGSAPITLPGPGSATHSYQQPGQFEASVTVRDAAGESTTVDDLRLDIRVGATGSPTAVASASPTSGNAPLTVSFSGAASSDADGGVVLYEWDFDYDGVVFDVQATGVTASHSYTGSGTHFAALRVTDDSGLTAIDVEPVVVASTVTLSVLDDTVDPYQGESVSVRTTLSADTDVTVYLRERGGRRVRTLFSGHRPRGTHDDAWDGRGDDGAIVLDGDYYAEVAFERNGLEVVEPDTPSGGAFRYVSWSESKVNGQTFDPWKDEFWQLTFDTAARGATASEVTLWITPFGNRNEITATLLNADVFGSGRYRQWWAGLKDDGTYIEPRGQRRASGNDYLWSAQAFTLPSNAIVVEGGRPWLDPVAADQNVYYPDTHRCLYGKGNDIELTLSREGAVTMHVFNMETGSLMRLVQTDFLPAGHHVVEWDGRAESGEFAAPGRYRADIIATSREGNVSYRRNVLILVTY